MENEGVTWLHIKNRGWNKTYFLRHDLRQMGYQFDAEHREWIKKQIDEDDLETAKRFCKKHGFKLIVDLPQYRRSSVYHRVFMKTHPGLFNGRLYLCAYCGRPLNAAKVSLSKNDSKLVKWILNKTINSPNHMLTVDHLVPVNAVQKSKLMRWVLNKIKIDNINDPRNLVPACIQCNQAKGTRTGVWIIRGLLGRYPISWCIFWGISILLIIYAIQKINISYYFHFINLLCR